MFLHINMNDMIIKVRFWNFFIVEHRRKEVISNDFR